MSTKPETLFRKKVVESLKCFGEDIVVFSIQQVSIRGTPDLLICLGGEFIALELKSSDGLASSLQLYNINRINKAGGRAFVVYPDNWDEILRKLKRRKNNGRIQN